jgi:hypothetical protein
MTRLPDFTLAAIKQRYQNGTSAARACRELGLHEKTVNLYYVRLRESGLARIKRARRKAIPLHAGWAEPYEGDTFIGDAIDKAPVRSGPDWIGKAIVNRLPLRSCDGNASRTGNPKDVTWD